MNVLIVMVSDDKVRKSLIKTWEKDKKNLKLHFSMSLFITVTESESGLRFVYVWVFLLECKIYFDF